MVMGILMFSAVLVLLGNLLADSAQRRRRSAHPAGLSAMSARSSPHTGRRDDAAQPRRRAARSRALAALPAAPPGAVRARSSSCCWCSACVVGPHLMPYDDLHIDIRHRFQAPFAGPHLLGTDQLGRDLLVRLLMAGRISLTVGFVAMALSTVVGTLVGVVAGYYGGLDRRGADALRRCGAVLSHDLPAAGARGLHHARTSSPITLIIAATAWMEVARVVEAQIRALRDRDFAVAARGDRRVRPLPHGARTAAQRDRRRSSSRRR